MNYYIDWHIGNWIMEWKKPIDNVQNFLYIFSRKMI